MIRNAGLYSQLLVSILFSLLSPCNPRVDKV